MIIVIDIKANTSTIKFVTATGKLLLAELEGNESLEVSH